MKIDRILMLLKDGFPDSKIDRLSKDFDEKDICKFADLYDKEKYQNFNFQDWYNLSEEYKKDKEMQIALIMHPNIPEDIIYKIVANKSYQDVYSAVLTNSKGRKMSNRIAKVCVEKINPKTLNSLFRWDDINRPINCLNQGAYNVICIQALKDVLHNPERQFTDIELHSFNFFDNDAYYYMIEKLLKKDEVQEKFTTAIANNVNIPTEIRNQAFDRGAYYLWITNTTPHMMRTIYESTIDNVMSCKSGEIDSFARTISAVTLSNLIESGIPLSYQRDIVARYIDILPAAIPSIQVLDAIMKYTKDEDIMEQLLTNNFPIKTKEPLLRTRKLPNRILMPTIRVLTQSFLDCKSLGYDGMMSIYDASQRGELDKDIYDLLLTPINEKDGDLIDKFSAIYSAMCNIYTPIDVLENMAEGLKNQKNEIYVCGKIIAEAKKVSFQKGSIDFLRNLLKHKTIIFPHIENDVEFDELMDFLTNMSKKYKSDTFLHNELNTARELLYKCSKEELSQYAIRKTIFSLDEDPIYKYQLYCMVDKTSKNMEENIKKMDKMIDYIYVNYAEEFEFSEPKHEDFDYSMG